MELNGQLVGMLNSGCTNKEDISDEELKKLIGHDKDGRNLVIFALAVLPEFQKQGIARRLMPRFFEEAKNLKKKKNSVDLQIRFDQLLREVGFYACRDIEFQTRRFDMT